MRADDVRPSRECARARTPGAFRSTKQRVQYNITARYAMTYRTAKKIMMVFYSESVVRDAPGVFHGSHGSPSRRAGWVDETSGYPIQSRFAFSSRNATAVTLFFRSVSFHSFFIMLFHTCSVLFRCVALPCVLFSWVHQHLYLFVVPIRTAVWIGSFVRPNE